MTLKKYIKIFFYSVLFLALTVGFKVEAQGQLGSTHTQNLIIVKYGLKKGVTKATQSQAINEEEKINNIPVESDESELAPVAGVQYCIQKIQPIGDANAIKITDSTTYKELGCFSKITTNSEGLASMNLSDGFYIITELSDSEVQLFDPAKPILIRLPVVNNQKNGYLNTVYIYPKSSIDPEENYSALKTKTTLKKLPKTGESSELNSTIIGFLFLSLTAIFVLRARKERRMNE